MTDKVFTETVRIIAAKAEVDPDSITTQTELETLDIQSLDLAEVIFELEDAFDIEIEMNAASAFDTLKTVGDVCDAVRTLRDA